MNPQNDKEKNQSTNSAVTADKLLKKLKTGIIQNDEKNPVKQPPVKNSESINKVISKSVDVETPEQADVATRHVYKYNTVKRVEYKNDDELNDNSLNKSLSEQKFSASAASDLDETDMNLMIAFGMDDELKKRVGRETADKVEDSVQRSSADIDDKAAETGEIQKTEFEFTSNEQSKEVFKQYKAEYHSLLWRFLSVGILLIISFLYENLEIFGTSLPTPVNPDFYSTVHVLIGLQIFVLGAALIYRQLYNGLWALIKLKPIPESVTFVVTAITLIYHIVLCFISSPEHVQLYNFPVMVCILLTIVYEFMNLRREIYSFNIASSKRVKYAIAKLQPEQAELENETFYDYLPENPIMFKVDKVNFVDGFFRRMNTYTHNKSILNAIIVFSVAISLILFFVGFFVTGDAYVGFVTAYITIVICMPFSVLVTYSYPFFKASKEAYVMGSAIIGETSLDEYSTASAISFDDKDVFPPSIVKVKSIKVYGVYRIDQILYFAANLFRGIGGPLSDVFEQAMNDIQIASEVELIEVADDGIESMVDGVHIYLGKASYLYNKNYTPVTPEEDADIENNSDDTILYMVCNDIVCAKLFIHYPIDSEFESILKQLYKAGMCIGIKTFDPDINDRMMSARIKVSKYPVKILRGRANSTRNEASERIDSGIISKVSAKSMLKTLSLCDKVTHVIKTNLIIKIVSMIISVIIMSVVLFLNLSFDLSSFYVVLYQIFWIVPMYIVAKLLI